ncbi:MAG: 50S ribosomal protein L28 [Alphaproteobacteria bacterium]|nr:50S ribosomal protein L28 [Alphaproteobacteria bacterium]
MSRRCDVTGKGVQTGNNVSHAKNRTRRRFLPNLQKASFLSETLGRTVQMRLTTRAIRTIEFKGGIDAFMAATPARKLTGDALLLKKQISRCASKLEDAA